MDEIVTISDGGMTARVKLRGAELCSLVGPMGDEVVWAAGAAWPRHAPILFPIVGRLAGDQLRHRGRSYPMTQHGFARDRPFILEDRGPARVRLSLEDSPDTDRSFPFPFKLSVTFGIADGVLGTTYHLANPGEANLYASIGAHPAFRWPLRDGVAKALHRLTFSCSEPAPVRRLRGGLLDPAPRPTPITGTVLALDEALFAEDAIILDRLASRWVRYSAPGCESLAIAWEGFNALGLWSKPGADFLCIEPWHGLASPVDFDGEFRDKPGVFAVAPEESRLFTHSIAVGAEGCDRLTDGRR